MADNRLTDIIKGAWGAGQERALTLAPVASTSLFNSRLGRWEAHPNGQLTRLSPVITNRGYVEYTDHDTKLTQVVFANPYSTGPQRWVITAKGDAGQVVPSTLYAWSDIHLTGWLRALQVTGIQVDTQKPPFGGLQLVYIHPDAFDSITQGTPYTATIAGKRGTYMTWNIVAAGRNVRVYDLNATIIGYAGDGLVDFNPGPKS